MTRRERLFHSIAGLPVDRPAVSFYEINGLTEDWRDPDPYNIFNGPGWQELIQLTAEKSDRMVLTPAETERDNRRLSPIAGEQMRSTTEERDGRRYIHLTIGSGPRALNQLEMVEPGINTVWRTEHPVHSADDLRYWIDLPDEILQGTACTGIVTERERLLGDTGVVLLDTPDALCIVAMLMSMEDFTVLAMTEPELFEAALRKAARFLQWNLETVAAACPGRIWRIYGPEFAAPPYLPPEFFARYVTQFDAPMVAAIHRSGGYARIHCHGRIRQVLDEIVRTGCDGIDPVEPPPQGDMELAEVRERYGDRLTLFGNLEASDIENLDEAAFRQKVRQALTEGTRGTGRGFVLMPSACPYGRVLSPRAFRNYRTMIEETENFG